MEEKDLDKLFNDLERQFDFKEPTSGHQARFEKRLSSIDSLSQSESKVISFRRYIAPLTAVAAILLLFFGLNFFNANNNKVDDLADVSTEMAKTQNFFTLAIKEELSKIEGKRSPDTQKLIDDAMVQLDILEKDYKKLQNDLQLSGDDNRVIYAMITNFQTRVDLLKNVLEQINQVSNFKNNNNEDTNTI